MRKFCIGPLFSYVAAMEFCNTLENGKWEFLVAVLHFHKIFSFAKLTAAILRQFERQIVSA